MNVTMSTGVLLGKRCLLFNILNLFSCIRFYLLFNGLRFPFLHFFFLAQVKYLQIAKKSKTENPYRWVRYVTQSNSYVARL
jgi:hypothetical protein